MGVTRATSKPVRRVVQARVLGELVIEVKRETLVIRSLGARKPILEATYGEVVYAVLGNREPNRRRRR